MRKKGTVAIVVLIFVSLACTGLPSLSGGQTPQATEPPIPGDFGGELPGTPIQVVCTHHIALDGDDANPGTADAPWRGLQYAADTLEPGDTVCLHSGTYSDIEEVRVTRSGEADASITFAAAPGEAVEIRGSIYVTQDVSYINMVGFAVTGFRIWGITLQGGNHHFVFSGLEVGGGEAGFRFTEGDSGQDPAYGPVSDIVLENSVIHDAMYTAVDCTPGPCDRIVFRGLEIYGSGLEAGYGGDGLGVERGQEILVEDSYIHDNGGDGIDLNSRDFDGNVPGIIVRRNRVARNHLQGIKLWSGGRMENNVVWGQGIDPVMVGKYPCTTEVLNNTIVFNMVDPAYSERGYVFVAAYPEEGISPPITLIMVNNIFAFNTGPQVGSPTGVYFGPGVTLTESNNLFWSRDDGEIQAEFVQGHDSWFTRAEITDGTWLQFTGQGQGDVAGDPLFSAGWPDLDAGLMSGSPAIDAGDNAFCPEEDIGGQVRPVDGNHDGDAVCDIGAYEWAE